MKKGMLIAGSLLVVVAAGFLFFSGGPEKKPVDYLQLSERVTIESVTLPNHNLPDDMVANLSSDGRSFVGEVVDAASFRYLTAHGSTGLHLWEFKTKHPYYDYAELDKNDSDQSKQPKFQVSGLGEPMTRVPANRLEKGVSGSWYPISTEVVSKQGIRVLLPYGKDQQDKLTGFTIDYPTAPGLYSQYHLKYYLASKAGTLPDFAVRPMTMYEVKRIDGDEGSSRTTMMTLFAPAPTIYQFEVDLPRKAALKFFFGLQTDPLMGERGGKVRFVIDLIDEDGELHGGLFERTVSTEFDTRSNGYQWWRKGELKLGEFSGQRVTLKFKTLSVGADFFARAKNDYNFGLWGNPVLFSEVSPPPDPKDAKPNVLLVCIDTLRWDRLGCYKKNDNPTSEQIDRLAEKGVVFKNAVSPSSWTRPAVASLLTGVTPALHGLMSESSEEVIHPEFDTLAEILKADGYTTAGFSTSANVSEAFRFDQGFDRFSISWDFFSGHKFTDMMVLPWLQENSDKPFFLYVHYLEPHDPYSMHDEFNFDPDYTGQKWFVVRDFANVEGGNTPEQLTAYARRTLDQPALDHMLSRYDSEIAYIDTQIGRLMATLKEQGVADNTIVIVTADHGEEFKDHQGFYHGFTLYEELVHVPLIVYAPGVTQAGKTVSSPVSLIDVVPTVMALTGAKRQSKRYALEGKSLLPLLGSGEPTSEDKERIIYMATRFRGPVRYGLRQGDRKLIYYDQGKDMEGIYKLIRIGADGFDDVLLPPYSDDDQTFLATMQDKLRTWFRENQAKNKTFIANAQRANLMSQEELDRMRQLGYLSGEDEDDAPLETQPVTIEGLE